MPGGEFGTECAGIFKTEIRCFGIDRLHQPRGKVCCLIELKRGVAMKGPPSVSTDRKFPIPFCNCRCG
jgi:hypothetical protein